MENQNHPKLTFHPNQQKIQEESSLEKNTTLDKLLDADWRYLLAKIYQNIDGPSLLKKKKSSRLNIEEDSSPSSETESFRCNCKKTKCLKLYCECFAKGQYCKGCNCQSCNNTSEYDSVRSGIIDEIIEKNPKAFDAFERTKTVRCICKKTGCLKKYCECFNVGKKCGQECKCLNCLNFT